MKKLVTVLTGRYCKFLHADDQDMFLHQNGNSVALISPWRWLRLAETCSKIHYIEYNCVCYYSTVRLVAIRWTDQGAWHYSTESPRFIQTAGNFSLWGKTRILLHLVHLFIDSGTTFVTFIQARYEYIRTVAGKTELRSAGLLCSG